MWPGGLLLINMFHNALYRLLLFGITDILLFGMGDKAERLSPEALRYLKGNKISFEVLTTVS